MGTARHEHSGLKHRFNSSYWVSGAWSRAAAHTHTHAHRSKPADRPERLCMRGQGSDRRAGCASIAFAVEGKRAEAKDTGCIRMRSVSIGCLPNKRWRSA